MPPKGSHLALTKTASYLLPLLLLSKPVHFQPSPPWPSPQWCTIRPISIGILVDIFGDGIPRSLIAMQEIFNTSSIGLTFEEGHIWFWTFDKFWTCSKSWSKFKGGVRLYNLGCVNPSKAFFSGILLSWRRWQRRFNLKVRHFLFFTAWLGNDGQRNQKERLFSLTLKVFLSPKQLEPERNLRFLLLAGCAQMGDPELFYAVWATFFFFLNATSKTPSCRLAKFSPFILFF